MPDDKIPMKHRLLNLKTKLRWKWYGVRSFFGKYRKPMEIIMEEGYGGTYPACPRCHELVYYENRCCFCGQRFLPGAQTVGKVLDNAE